jgi:hypothetical protein
LGCSDDHLHRTKCSVSDFSTGCPLNLYHQNCKLRLNDVNSNDDTDKSPAFTYGTDSVCLNRTVKIIFVKLISRQIVTV